MRYAVLADIHSNLAAFQAVLSDVKAKGGFDQLWCLGDIVGYGPEPLECIALLREHNHVSIPGNHDWAAIGKIETTDFNPVAAHAAHWTAKQLLKDDVEYLESLSISLYQGEFTLVHGSPRYPIWEYLLSTKEAQESFSYFDTSYCLIGHSHIPLIFEHADGTEPVSLRRFEQEVALPLGKNRLIINPGSVGQPRDGDPRASYGLYDSTEGVFRHCRVAYDIAATQDKMVKAGLPPPLIARLGRGI